MRWQLAIAVASWIAACGGGSGGAGGPVVEGEVTDGTLDELSGLRTKLVDAATAKPDDFTFARLAEIDGLAALLYGIQPPAEELFKPVAEGSPGHREAIIGKVALELTRVKTAEQLDRLAAELARIPASRKDDPWRRWLAARIVLVRGDRIVAGVKLDDIRHPVARTDRAMLFADAGEWAKADKLLGAEKHPLAVLAHAIVRAENDDVAGAVGDLEAVTIDAPRIAGYKLVAHALIGIGNERYDLAADALGKLGKMRVLPNECALWARIAWAHLHLGRSVDRTNDHKIASIARQHCATIGKSSGDNQLLVAIDAHLQLGLGRPAVARKIAGQRGSTPWAGIAEAYARLELGTREYVEEVEADLATARKRPPSTVERRVAEVLFLQAKAVLAKTAAERADLLGALATMADTATSQRTRYALGAAHFAVGDLASAKRELRRVVEETSPRRPDPFAYRTHQLLAEIALATDDLEIAGPEIDRALEIHPGNATSYVIQARIRLRANDPENALESLAVLRKAGDLDPVAKLVAAEALVALKAPTPAQRQQAADLVREAAGKLGTDALLDKLGRAEVGRVAALVDPKLPGELKLPVGKLPRRKT